MVSAAHANANSSRSVSTTNLQQKYRIYYGGIFVLRCLLYNISVLTFDLEARVEIRYG